MSLNIGRKGWIGVGLQSGFQVPAAIADYVDFETNTVTAIQEQIEVTQAQGLRDRLNSTVPGKRYSGGDIQVVADSTKLGYWIVGALGTVQTSSLGSGVSRHTVTRNNSNDPQFLTFTSDRGTDRQLYADNAVSKFVLQVGTDMAQATSTLVGNFPMTTTSGTKTTASGTYFNFANAQFAFGTTISGAQSAANIKPYDFTLTIDNHSEAVFAHGQPTPKSINHKEFDVTADFNVYFENTTDRDNYYNQNKQAASFQMTGAGIGGGFTESVTFNFYKTSFKSLPIETGLANYFAEKASLVAEYDPSTLRTVDAVLVNAKSLYI